MSQSGKYVESANGRLAKQRALSASPLPGVTYELNERLDGGCRMFQPTKRHVGQKLASDKMTRFSRAKAGFTLVLNGLWINSNKVSVDSSR
jgi:hypothetical protein